MKTIMVWGGCGVLALSALGCANVEDELGPTTSPEIDNDEVRLGVTTSALQSAFHPIRNTGNGLCLQPDPSNPRAETAAIVQMPCNYGNLAQLWKEEKIAGGHYMFLNQLSGQCMNTFDGALSGGRLLQTVCKRISNEEFNTGVDLPNITFIESRERFRNTGYCVDVPGASSAVGLGIQFWSCNGTPAQRWVIGFDL